MPNQSNGSIDTVESPDRVLINSESKLGYDVIFHPTGSFGVAIAGAPCLGDIRVYRLGGCRV